MIKKIGNLFDSDADYIGHGVNCRGIMGAGIAKEFRRRYPDMYVDYVADCSYSGFLRPGGFSIYVPESGPRVVNLATQDAPGAHAQYEWVWGATSKFAASVSRSGRSVRVALPTIGCGIGGLEWPKVETILRAVEIIYENVEFEIWKLPNS